jgi:hypothetical protein
MTGNCPSAWGNKTKEYFSDLRRLNAVKQGTQTVGESPEGSGGNACTSHCGKERIMKAGLF